MKAILKSLPASNVAKIETIGSPSAKYEAEGTAGIINIIMAQAQTEGFSGTASSWNALAENFRTFNNASLQYVNEKWTLSANGGFGLFNNRIESESKQYLWQGTDTNIAPYRAYFITTADLGDAATQEAPFRIAVDEEQGIRMVEQEDGTVKACYDLTGRRLGEDRNGLVIENGKLIFVK